MSIEGVRASRERRNFAERAFEKSAKEKGWYVTKKGYPDFICYSPGGGIILVEVKGNKNQRLKKDQWRFTNSMKNQYGVKCYKWSPDSDWMLSKHNATLEGWKKQKEQK